MTNVSILATNADLKGIYCDFMKKVIIKNIQIAGHSEGLETTSIGQGITLQNVDSVDLNTISFSNLRIGLSITHKYSCFIKLQEIEIYKCSFGLNIDALESNLLLGMISHRKSITIFGHKNR